MERLKIGGLKLSFALCQFELRAPDPPQKILSTISSALSTEKINIEFLTHSSNKDGTCCLSLCVGEDNFASTAAIIHGRDRLPLHCDVKAREQVGMLTIFPYRSPLAILGVILAEWKGNSMPVYGVATSLSAISVLTDFSAMDKAVEIIQSSFQLPSNHAPLRPELHYYQGTATNKD